ncbi:MAG: hypothetical protein D6805_10210, partial [Planctomycetota bacterium]
NFLTRNLFQKKVPYLQKLFRFRGNPFPLKTPLTSLLETLFRKKVFKLPQNFLTRNLFQKKVPYLQELFRFRGNPFPLKTPFP